MGTRENRGLHELRDLHYPGDLRDREWAVNSPLVPPAKGGGRRRARPKDLPPRTQVHLADIQDRDGALPVSK